MIDHEEDRHDEQMDCARRRTIHHQQLIPRYWRTSLKDGRIIIRGRASLFATAGLAVAFMLGWLGVIDTDGMVLMGAALAALGYGIGIYVFPVRKWTPFGSVDEIESMDDAGLQETFDSLFMSWPNEVISYVDDLERSYPDRTPRWARRVLRASRGQLLPAQPDQSDEMRRFAADYWDRVRDRHDIKLKAWERYELDPGAVIDHPSMADPTVPQTAVMLWAMRSAAAARECRDVGAYAWAVFEFEEAFNLAEREARERAVSSLNEGERE